MVRGDPHPDIAAMSASPTIESPQIESPEIESPCVKVCVIDPASGLCRGCGRRLEEIARWASMGAAERGRIMAELPARRVAAGFPD